MSSGAQQLKEDFEQVQKLLEMYPNIKIIKTEGEPPEQYDIEYTIKGYKTNPDGTTTPDNNHEVRITLPFGYPHFPPTAKPITPIFHPDIDPDAIRIADFWQENHSLPDLIVHIGQMICGNHYTEEEPFNQSALDWFKERKTWLPFDVLEPRDEDDIAEDAEAALTSTEPAEAETQQTFAPATDLDILKDDIDFPFDDLEEPDEAEDEISFAIEDDTETDILADLEGEGQEEDEISLDFGVEVSTETFDLQDTEEDDTEDIFDLETDEAADDISLDLTDETEEIESVEETPPTDDLFNLEADTTDEEAPLEFDSEDIASAFEEEAGSGSEESEAVDITLDDLAGLDEEEVLGSGTADLSGLEEETAETTVPEPGETGGDVEQILSSLSLDEEFASADKPGEQSQIIRSLIEQKQIFSAKKVLADLPDPDSLPDKEEFELTIANAVSEAEDLYKKADANEQEGEFQKAGIFLDLIANIATDYPGLDFARNRIRESMMEESKKQTEATADKKEAEPAKAGETEPSAKKPGKKKKARAKLSFRMPTRLVVILLAVVVIGGIGAGGAYVYKNDDQNTQVARKSFQRAEQLIDSKEFKDAQKEFKTARAALEKILIFQGSEKEALNRKITGITNSNSFKEGLKGRVLYGDQYVSVETAKAIDKFNTQRSYAEQVHKGGKLEQAIIAYEKSLPYAEKAGFEEQVKFINHKIIELRLENAMAQAKQSEDEQNWLGVEKAYQEALELSNNISTKKVQKDIANRLAIASYRYGMDEGLKAINDSQWQQSIDAFQGVQKVLKANPQIVPETDIIEVEKLLVQSRLYFKLAEARKAYESKAWKPTIEIYNDAITLLKTNSTLLGQEATDNIKKIEKTILTTKVAREQDLIASTSASNALDKTVEHYEAIITLIENSAFKDDKTLAKILDNARTKGPEIKNQLLINKREKWLTDNYDKIFRDSYPSAKLSDLMNPKVQFIKREGNILIFNMSCSERKQGSTYRLELNYQHDLDKKAWSIYSGTLEEE